MSADDPVTRLEDAASERRAARERVEAIGEDSLRELRSAVSELRSLLVEYEDRATGDGDFAAFIEFQDRIAHFTDELSEELPERETFEAIDEHLQQRRLTESDFAEVRDRIDDAERGLEPLEAWEDARERYEQALVDARRRRETVEARIADCERLVKLGEADLEAPTEHLRGPIETYDDAVTEAFRAFRSSEPARDVLELVETTRLYPLVPFETPPSELLTYVREYEAGTEPIPTLLEYADYSRSKLDHYVDDAAELTRRVATQRTYLQRLDAEPLTVGWPPPPADQLRWECDELLSVVDRFAPEVVTDLRDVRALTRRDDYDRLQTSAAAREQLSAAERERLSSGAVADELADLRSEREALREALDEYDSL